MLHLYWGDGKGKTTAAMGLALRALGHGRRVVILQFLKDGSSGEIEMLRRCGAVVYACPNAKFTWLMTDAERAIQIIGQTAHLEFHLVRDDVDPSAIILPAGTARYPLIVKGPHGEQSESSIVLDTESLMGGEDITKARPAFNQYGQAYVALEFNS